MEFHEKLQELRKQKSLTQEELAQSLYVSRTAVSKWESGRGYPNIDSLKRIAQLFGITVDALLSGEELLTIAQEDNRQKTMSICDLVFGLLDICSLLLLFFPFFGQKEDGFVQSVSLLFLTDISVYLQISYYVIVIAMAIWGILLLTLQNCQIGFWLKSKRIGSFLLSIAGVLLWIISSQPYAAMLLFVFLIIKGFLMFKKQ